MKKEFKRIRKVSKEIIGKKKYKKVKKLDNYEDRTEGLKYLVSSELTGRCLDLEKKIADKEKNILIIDAKFKRLLNKVKIFKSTYNKKDYISLVKLINEIEAEIEND